MMNILHDEMLLELQSLGNLVEIKWLSILISIAKCW